MSYGNGGYGQNPFDDRGNEYGGQQGGYSTAPYGQGGYGGGGNGYGQQGGYGGQSDLEMQNMNGGRANDPNAVLNECRDVDAAIDGLENDLQRLSSQQRRMLSNPDSTSATREIDALSASIMTAYRGLVDRVRKIKSDPNSGNPRNGPQVGRVDRRLKGLIQKYQTQERDFRRDLQEQQARQYRIVRPDATEEEVRQATEEPNQQIFQQALLNSNRRGQAQSTLNAVQDRHREIQKIEQQMIELAQLFQDLDVLVVQQEPLVMNIEQKGEEVVDNVTNANEQIDTAIKSARSRNRKKWWCLLVVVLIIIVIAVIAVVVVLTQRAGQKVATGQKRAITY